MFGQSTAAPKPSLFGGSTTANPTPSAFGTATTTGPPAFGGSILQSNPAVSTSGQVQAQPTGSYFDSLLAKSKKQGDGETTSEGLPSLQLGLGDLRQRLRKLGPGSQGKSHDGKAHYLLAASGIDPGAAVKDIGSFGVQSGIFDKQHGAAGGEVDVETYLANIQNKTTMSMIADGLERSLRDFDRFLDDNVTMEWDAQRMRIYQHFGIKVKEDAASGGLGKESTGGFGRSRRRSQQAPAEGARPSQKGSAFGRSGMERSVIGSPARVGSHRPQFSDVDSSAASAVGSLNGVASLDDRFMREKQGKLAEKVHALNDSRMLLRPYPILYELAEIEPKSGDRHNPHLIDSYYAMMDIVGEDPDADAVVQGETARQRQYARFYLDPNSNSANSMEMRKRILKGANRHLERKFFSEVEAVIAKYQNEANQGGRPDVVSKIKAYVRVQHAHKKLAPNSASLQKDANDDFVWAIIFYLLRSGFVTEAATYVNDNIHQMRTIDRNFSGYISMYATSEDRRLKRPMQDRINNEYNQRARNAPEGSIDPYRMACYKIVGRCDVHNRSLDGLAMDVGDWIWLQFNLAREGDRTAELASDMYGLVDLQAKIREVGLKHFSSSGSDDGNGGASLFFYMQVLAGLFEQAVAYLYLTSYVDAVHFGIALEYYGLLRAADAVNLGNELLTHNTRGLPQLNFARMIGYYTRDFRAADVAAAVDYLILICLNMDDGDGGAGQQQASLCYEALRELVLETREFSKLIGDIRPDGTRIRGVIEERGLLIGLDREQDLVKQISLQAAGFADDNGRTTDAVLLYHLAGDYDAVVGIVSRALSEAVSVEIGQDPMKLIPVKPRVEGDNAAAEPGSSLSLAALDDPVELARTMMTMYERDQMFRSRISEANRVACSVLLQLSEIKALVEDSKWPQCIDVSIPSPLLPVTPCIRCNLG
jgi:nuclear pore complex protein Nup93